MKINFDIWENYEFNSKNSKYFDMFLNQKIKTLNYGYNYGNINLHINKKNAFELKEYLFFYGLNYDIINDNYINLNDFYIYLRYDMNKNYSLEIHNRTYDEYKTIELIE